MAGISCIIGIFLAAFGNAFPSSPDESTTLFFYSHYRETGQWSFNPPLNEEFGTTIFAPRQSFEVGSNEYGPFYAFFVVVLVTMSSVVPLEAVLAACSLLSSFGAIIIGRRIGGTAVGLLGGTAVALSTPLAYYGSKAYGNIPSVSLIVMAIWCLIDSNRGRRSTVCGLFLYGGAILLRDDAIVAAPIILVLAYPLKKAGLAQFKRFLLPIAFISIFLIVSLSLSEIAAASYSLLDNIREKLGGFFGPPITYWHSFRSFVLASSALAGLGMAAFAAPFARPPFRRFALAAVSILLIYLAAFGARLNTWKFWDATPDSSLQRYFVLPSLMMAISGAIILTVFAGGLQSSSKALAVGTVCLLLMVGFVSPAGTFMREDRERLRSLEESFYQLNNPDQPTALFTKYLDKYITSPRLRLAVYRTPEDLAANPKENLFFSPTPLENVTKIATSLFQQGYEVVIGNDANDLQQALRKQGYDLTAYGRVPALRIASGDE